jgi:hypothetical protein
MAASTVAILTRALAEWVARPGNQKFLHDEQLPVIEQALASPGQQAQLPVATWFLGTFRLARGQVRVLDGDAYGWEEARIGLSLLRCSLLLRIARHRPQPGRTDQTPFQLLPAANTVALGIALCDPDGEDLFAAFARLPDRAFGETDQWPLFVRELARVRQGERPTVTPRLGEYRDVLLLWDGELLPLARALQALLELHLEQGKGLWFSDPWVTAMPIEVMAVLRVRQELSLPSPKVEHALMFTNLVTMIPAPKWPETPLADRILRLLRAERRR